MSHTVEPEIIAAPTDADQQGNAESGNGVDDRSVTGTEIQNGARQRRGYGDLADYQSPKWRNRLYRKAIRGDYPVPDRLRQEAVDTIDAILSDPEASRGERLSAIKTLACISAHNLRCIEVASSVCGTQRPASTGKVDVTVNIANVTSDPPARIALAEAARVLMAIPPPE